MRTGWCGWGKRGKGEGFIGCFRDDLGLGSQSLKGWGSRCGVVVLRWGRSGT